VAYENNDKKIESVYSNRVKAGKRRTYFFDVRETRGNDFFLTITESRKRFDSEGYDRHKIFLYKEDFNKFVKGLNEAVDYVKTELMPDFDFDAFNHDTPYEGDESQHGTTIQQEATTVHESSAPAKADIEIAETPDTEEPKAEELINPDNNHHSEEVDKW
jgi:hypothetical protein